MWRRVWLYSNSTLYSRALDCTNNLFSLNKYEEKPSFWFLKNSDLNLSDDKKLRSYLFRFSFAKDRSGMNLRNEKEEKHLWSTIELYIYFFKLIVHIYIIIDRLSFHPSNR